MTDEKEKTQFKLLGVGLDTTTINFRPVNPYDLSYSYLYTSIEANNDFIIADFIDMMPDATIITGIDFLDNAVDLIEEHLKTIKRYRVDCLLIDSKVDWGYYDKSGLKDFNRIDEIGIKNPETVEELEKAKSVLGSLKYVAINISPLNFNFDVVTWCNNNGVTILGFNPMGGNISSASMINAFSTPYLLCFAANYCEVVFLSGRDLYLSGESHTYLKQLIGQESSSVFTLKKNVFRLYKPIKKVVNTVLKFDNSIEINYNSPELLYEYTETNFVLGKTKEDKVSFDGKNLDSITEQVKDLFEVISVPEDGLESDYYAAYRYRAINYLSSKYNKDNGWMISCNKLGDRMIAIKVEKTEEKGWFKKREVKTDNNFFFALLSGNTPFFCELKNTSE